MAAILAEIYSFSYLFLNEITKGRGKYVYNFLLIVSSFTGVCGMLAESADGEGNCNYINLHV